MRRGQDGRRAWVVLPPGAGKTLAGLEFARRAGRRTVVFSPNTAIQGQWVSHVQAYAPPTITAGTDRAITADVTSLTYQSLASFDPEREVDEEGDVVPRSASSRPLLEQLSENGRALVQALRQAGPLTLVLDECHHLLEVWGRLLGELLDRLRDVVVLGLTATPPESLSREQAELVAELFGEVVYATSIPAVVREGHLAPFAELAWLTAPTPQESGWLAEEAVRFQQLTTDLTDPEFSSRPFLSWLDERFVHRSAADDVAAPVLDWSRIERDEPALAAAALRFHHAGLLALPAGARLREEHQVAPSAADWTALLEDWVRHHLSRSDEPADIEAMARLRDALPSVGYRLTRTGIGRGRSPVDRVLARSAAKTHAATAILTAESRNLGSQLRALVLCDHEQATATLPARLTGVIDQQAGSARLALHTLAADPVTTALCPMLVTGSTVAAPYAVASHFVGWAREHGARLDDLPDGPATEPVEISGRWSARTWVPLVTRYFEAGHAQVLVGTRGLLGEGWDACGVNTVVDLTAATTATAVVQTRGRALRVDPAWPGKVANTWTVTAVSEAHPGGDHDWQRLVRKHSGYFCVTDSGEIADGVTHVDPTLSPFAPPPVADFDAFNVRMLDRAERREQTRALWQVGEPYRDTLVHTVRVRGRRPAAPPTVPEDRGVPAAPGPLPDARGVRLPPGESRPAGRIGLSATVGVAVLVAGVLAPVPVAAAVLAAVAAGAAVWLLTRGHAAGAMLDTAAGPPGVLRFGYAVADALHGAGLSPRGAESVSVLVEPDGAYRLALGGVPAEVSETFASGLEEVLDPMGDPRYVIARYELVRGSGGWWARAYGGLRWLSGRAPDNPVVYHAVPSVLGANAGLAQAFADSWSRWVSPASATYTGNPTGAGILAAHRGADPFAADVTLRAAWE